VQAKLANDPTAPPPNTLSFATYGDPLAKHAFGESFLTQMFPVGSVVPSLDFRMPAPVESQYDTYQFVSAYDSIADWPDRSDNWMSVLNAVVGLATGHTAVAFTNPSMVPPQNIRTPDIRETTIRSPLRSQWIRCAATTRRRSPHRRRRRRSAVAPILCRSSWPAPSMC
jgi:hypothetical protein